MRRTIFITMIVLFASHVQTNAQSGIRFESDSFFVLLNKANAEHKLLFIDCYTDWCGPCKRMEKTVYVNDTASTYYNDHFICAKFDMEKGEGIDIAKRYEVKCYPTYLYIDGNGNLVHRASGAVSTSTFVTFGKSALSQELNFAAQKAAYHSGKLSAEKIAAYLELRSATCLPVNEEIETFFSDTTNLLQNTYIWIILRTYPTEPHSNAIQYLTLNRMRFAKLHTIDSVDAIIERSWANAMARCLYHKGEPDTVTYFALREELANQKLPFIERLLLRMEMLKCEVKADWSCYATCAISYMPRFAPNDAPLLNNTAWAFYEHVENTAYIDSALSWSARAVAIDPNYFFLDTYAALLYKRGRFTEAKVQAERAIAIAKEWKIDCDGTEELLEKIKESSRKGEKDNGGNR